MTSNTDLLMSKAYRIVDDNAYSSVIKFDEGMDDFEDDEEYDHNASIDIEICYCQTKVVIVIMIGKIYQSNQSCSMELHCL